MKRAGLLGFALGVLIAMAVTQAAPALEPGGIQSREREILTLETEQAEELETLAVLHAAEQAATEENLGESGANLVKRLNEIQALLSRQKSERQAIELEQKEEFCARFGMRCAPLPAQKQNVAQSAI